MKMTDITTAVINRKELLDFLAAKDIRYFSNSVEQICTYLLANKFHKIIFDFDIDTVYYLIQYFEIKEQYLICDYLQKMILKHNELTNEKYSINYVNN